MRAAELKDRELARRIMTHAGYTPDARYIMGGSDPHPIDINGMARTLRRAERTLHRWSEEECNGTIQREGDEGTGKPFRPFESFYIRKDGSKAINRHKVPTPDREAGALRRVAEVCKATGLHYFHQTDPRGCALYVSTEPLTASNYSSRGIPCYV